MLLHFVIPFILICYITMFWKIKFWPNDPIPRVEAWGGGGLRAKYLLPCCCNLWFPLIWYATWPCPERVGFWPLTQSPYGRRRSWVCGLTICYHVATFRDSIWFNMQHDQVLKKCNSDLFTPSLGVMGGGGSAGNFFPTMLLHFMIPWNLICNMTMFYKNDFWPIDQIPRVGGGGIFATMLLHSWFPLIWYAT